MSLNYPESAAMCESAIKSVQSQLRLMKESIDTYEFSHYGVYVKSERAWDARIEVTHYRYKDMSLSYPLRDCMHTPGKVASGIKIARINLRVQESLAQL